jgi:flavin-dependent dehydrogenase
MRPQNIIEFDSPEAGLQNGYNGCGHCMPRSNYPGTPYVPSQVHSLPALQINNEQLNTGFSITGQNEPWDVVIIGAGPIGLTAAKLAQQWNLRYIVLEQGNECGGERRAETVNSNLTFNRIWGEGFLESISVARHFKNMLYSPYAKYAQQVIITEAPHSFHWKNNDQEHPGLIDKMVEVLKRKDFNVSFNVKVLAATLSESEPASQPVKSIITSKGTIRGTTFLDCSGYSSRLGRQLAGSVMTNQMTGIENSYDIASAVYDIAINPIVKSNWRNHYPTNEFPDFQTFFVPQGAVKCVAGSPPGAIVVFPDGRGNAEINFQVFDEYGQNFPVKWPDQVAYVQKMWDELKTRYPVFNEIMKRFLPGDKEYEVVTGMPSVGMAPVPMLVPGIALLGDAGGYVNPKSSSGLETGMQTAEFWMYVAMEMRHRAWTMFEKMKYNNAFCFTPLSSDLSAKKLQVSMQKTLMFGIVHWGEEQSWDYPLSWIVTILGYGGMEKIEGLTIDEYSSRDWVQQAAVISAILNGVFVFDMAQNKILEFMGITKHKYPEHWDDFIKAIGPIGLISKFEGALLDGLFLLLGPGYAVDYAISRNSKTQIIRYVTVIDIRKASLEQRSSLIRILLSSRPLGNPGENVLLNIMEITLEDFGPGRLENIVSQAGGIFQIYDCVQGVERQRLRVIYPVYKSCLICGGDGKLFTPVTCPSCNGTGIKNRVKCWRCSGAKSIPCWYCGGDGRTGDEDWKTPIKCWNCGGSGVGIWRARCAICGGDGKINDFWPPPESCPKCNGNKNLDCWACRGSGENITYCLLCGGDGKINDLIPERDCGNCSGTGKVLL